MPGSGRRGFFQVQVAAMALSLQRKITIILLALYWPTLFVFTHIPIPQVVREADVSDKGLHFLVYLVLVYLLWFAVRGDRKVSWRGMGPWCVLAALAVYGIFDEWSQGFVAGRSCDVQDFFADMSGMVTGLILLSVLRFWSAGLLVVAIVIFGLTNLTKADLGDLMPVTSGVFHLFAYATVTALWVQHVRHSRFGVRLHKTRTGRLLVILGGPMALLLLVKSFSMAFDTAFGVRDMLISAGGIGVVIAGVYVAPLFGRQEESRITGQQ